MISQCEIRGGEMNLIKILEKAPRVDAEGCYVLSYMLPDVDFDKWAKWIEKELIKLCFDGDMKDLIREFCTGEKR